MHPLASRLAPLMGGDLNPVRSIVAEWVLSTKCEEQRAALRAFGSELGAVQRRIRNRAVPPTCEEVEIALTAVLALATKRTRSEPPAPLDPAVLSVAGETTSGEGFLAGELAHAAAKEPLSS